MTHFVAQEPDVFLHSEEYREKAAATQLRVIAAYAREWKGAPWWKKLWVSAKIMAVIWRELDKLHPRHRLYHARCQP